jgi:hypothetical protein
MYSLAIPKYLLRHHMIKQSRFGIQLAENVYGLFKGQLFGAFGGCIDTFHCEYPISSQWNHLMLMRGDLSRRKLSVQSPSVGIHS